MIKGLVLGILSIFYFSFSWGFILYQYWYWFILDVFPNLPRITFHQAIGLKLFTGILIVVTNLRLKEEFYDSDKIGRTVYIVVLPWLSYLVGYIIHLVIN